MKNDVVKFLDIESLAKVPEPFLTEYAKWYNVPTRSRSGEHLGVQHIVHSIIALDIRPTVPVLSTHYAQYINDVLHFRYRTKADFVNPDVHGTFPAQLLPAPIDTYSDGEPDPDVPVVPQAAVKSHARPIMDFVFPPKGRRKYEPTETDLERERERGQAVKSAHAPPKAAAKPERLRLKDFVFPAKELRKPGFTPAPRAPLRHNYITEMFLDLEWESKRVEEEYKAAEKLMKNALYEYEALRMAMDDERQAWKDFYASLSPVTGDLANDCLSRAATRAAGEIPEDETAEAEVVGEIPALNEMKSRPPAPIAVTSGFWGEQPAGERVFRQPKRKAMAPPMTYKGPSILDVGVPRVTGGTAATLGHGAFRDTPSLKRSADDSDSDMESDGALSSAYSLPQYHARALTYAP